MLKYFFIGLFASSMLYGIEGTYSGSGTDPYEKKTYSVTATFTQDANGVIQATWEELENGQKTSYAGTGLKQSDSVSFTYQNKNNLSDCGLQTYKIKNDTLEGRFVELGKNLVGEELLTKAK